MSPMRVVPLSRVLHSVASVEEDAAIVYLRTVVAPTRTDAEIRDWLRRVRTFGGEPAKRDRMMDDLRDGLAREFDRFDRAAGNVAPASSVNAYRPLPFEALAPPGRPGFVVPELQTAYRDWCGRQRLIWYAADGAGEIPINPVTGREYLLEEFTTRERFVDNVSHGRARVLLDVLLGPNPGTRHPRAGSATPSRRNWPGKNPNWVRRQPTSQSRQDIVDMIRAADSPQGEDAVRQMIQDILNDPMNQYAGDLTDMTRLANSAGEIEASVSFVMTYLRRHAPKGSRGSAELASFGEAELTKIMGRSLHLHPRDFVHSILEARNIMNRSLELIGKERGMFSLWDLRGVEGCVDLCIQNSRKEKGFLFELDLASWLRTNILDPEGGPFANLNVFDMILEIKIDGLSGPDFGLLLRGGEGTMTLRIVQAKCYESPSLLTGFGGEYFKQFSSDIRRLWAHQRRLIDGGATEGAHVWEHGKPPKIGVEEAGEITYYPVDPHYQFYADKQRMESFAHMDRAAKAQDARDVPSAEMDAIAETAASLQEAEDMLNEFTGEVTRYLRPDMPNSKAARDWILDQSGRAIENLIPPRSAREVLEEHMDLRLPRKKGQPVPPRLLGVANMRRQLSGLPASQEIDKALLTPITARELMAMRIALDRRSGELDYDLVARILGMDPPFELHHALHEPEITVS